MKILESTMALWSKKSTKGEEKWLPLPIHLYDRAGIANRLWRDWVSEGLKQTLANNIEITNNPDHKSNIELAGDLFCFLAAIHDLGKATPAFQLMIRPKYHYADKILFQKLCAYNYLDEEFSCESFMSIPRIKHATATQMLLEKEKLNRKISSILGAHHGKPLSTQDCKLYKASKMSNLDDYYLGENSSNYEEKWVNAQKDILNFALHLSNFNALDDIPIPDMSSQIIYNGLLIIADWIASNEKLFSYIDIEKNWTLTELSDLDDMENRIDNAWKKLRFTDMWSSDGLWLNENYYEERFTKEKLVFNPRPMQSLALNIARNVDQPGIMVIEAPMGQGKTEAAFAVAEVFAGKSERSGIFFALPTQATSNGIFPRIKEWTNSLDDLSEHTIQLVHGKSQFNKEFTSIHKFDFHTTNIEQDNFNINDGTSDNLMVHQWFNGRKTSLLADFVVGTIDQLLLIGLKQKHLSLRHVGLANKVVIIDEVHAYDAYMSQYLEIALSYLGYYKVPVILLSATLPSQKRYELIEAYRGHGLDLYDDEYKQFLSKRKEEEWAVNRGYPLITYTDNNHVLQEIVDAEGATKDIKITDVIEDNIAEFLKEKMIDGGCIGIIVNTVKKAQRLHDQISKDAHYPVLLLHSAFIASDRAKKEEELLNLIGKNGYRPNQLIVIGTQILEQSLDIDFDLLISEICPMDLLLQRAGRLHRHDRNRPKNLLQSEMAVLHPEDEKYSEGTKYIYGECLLERTIALLPNQITLPDDIPQLVQDTYDFDQCDLNLPENYKEIEMQHKSNLKKMSEKAKVFRIVTLEYQNNLVDWLKRIASEKTSDADVSAAVRDTDDSIEVIMVNYSEEGMLYWEDSNKQVSVRTDAPPSIPEAKSLARQTIQLPSVLTKKYNIKDTINLLEDENLRLFAPLQQSSWLQGSLILSLNENNQCCLNGFRLEYSRENGLRYERIENDKN
ncbi:MAG: CRISPR-associated helicase Cas3' [Eubacteriaceae bacterium]|nr:CRISPR-associated helicase Cas3' [Eubacteriaceae bacterium]